MSILYYVNVPYNWDLSLMPVHKFVGMESNDLMCYSKGHRMFFTSNMQAVVQRVIGKEDQYLMSVARKDGREFEYLYYVNWLRQQLFPEDYVVAVGGVREDHNYELKPIYPMVVYDDIMHRQSPVAYKEYCIVRAIVKRV